MSNVEDGQNHSVAQIATAGISYSKIIESVPVGTRFFALIPISFIGAFTFITVMSPELRWVALVGIIFIVILCICFAYLLLRGIDLGTRTEMANLTKRNVVVAAPANEKENGVVVTYRYDVFIAAPMASRSDEVREAFNNEVKNIVDKIQSACGYTAFYAGYKQYSSRTDDEPEFALKHNVKRMRASKYFVLIYTECEPTSAFIELGMALALNKPSVWFVKKGVKKPYLMRGNGAGGSQGIPPIRVYEFEELSGVVAIIDRYGSQLFDPAAASSDDD